MKPVLLDTGVIVAWLDSGQSAHEACARVVGDMDGPLLTCDAVIAEACYLLRRVPSASEAVIENVVAGIFQIPFQLSREANAIRSILRKYRDQKIDLADACLIRLAEEFGTAEILTLDRDFAVYRWGRNKSFRMIP